MVKFIGAGWGGLTSAMLLQSRGFDVTIVEKDEQIGGRQGRVELGNCRLDSGPTILVMKYVLEETFCESGKKLADYVELRRLDPFFKIHFGDGRDMLLTSNHEKQKEEIRRLFPNEEDGLDRMMKIEKTRGIYLMKALARPYASFLDLINIDLLRSIPWLPLGRSFFNVLGDYFPSPALRWAFSFHSKYLG
jgi:phytoene desaturase